MVEGDATAEEGSGSKQRWGGRQSAHSRQKKECRANGEGRRGDREVQ